MKKHKGEFSIALMCKVLAVSSSGYYDWVNHTPGKRELENAVLDDQIKVVYMKNKQRYGSPRITKTLHKQDVHCSHTRVERRMKAMNLKAIAGRKFKVTTDSAHHKPLLKNVLDRDFKTTNINQKWAGDITYIATAEGWLYLAVVIDLHSRAVIGWAMSPRMKKQLVCDALLMALFKRGFPKDVVMHTDRGSQYCSKKYRHILSSNNLVGSMSRKGNCWDNAISESFFHTLKVELVHVNNYKSRDEARQSIFQYIEGYYNRIRMHSAIDYKAPVEVEYAA